MVTKAAESLRRYLGAPLPLASLAVFRVLFGLAMLLSVVRFVAKGWVEQIYIQPSFHFTYLGFGWVEPLSGMGMYWLFGAIGCSAACVALGLFYRLAIVAFFTLFTWVELIDVATYLNHYYFVSIVSFLLIFMPANRMLSVDVMLRPSLLSEVTPRWTLGVLRFQLGATYFFAGLAKLNADWLLEAQPLRTWLRMWVHLPWVGTWLGEVWVAYAMSWGGAIFDLTIVFALLSAKTRSVALLTALVFHLVTGALFNIGVFPMVMLISITLFCEPSWPTRWLAERTKRVVEPVPSPLSKLGFGLLSLFVLVQVLMPLRHWLYPGKTTWTEQGYRFSWNVMRIEKTGMVEFRLTDPVTGLKWRVYPRDELTSFQEKMMSTQPDLILQFAHVLADRVEALGKPRPQVRVDSWAALNGRPSQRLIDPDVDLAAEPRGWGHKGWISPLGTVEWP